MLFNTIVRRHSGLCVHFAGTTIFTTAKPAAKPAAAELAAKPAAAELAAKPAHPAESSSEATAAAFTATTFPFHCRGQLDWLVGPSVLQQYHRKLDRQVWERTHGHDGERDVAN
jgi:hypothetical protein